MATDRPEEVVDALLADLNGRSGVGIEYCEQEIQDEIRETWIQIVESWVEVISKEGGTPVACNSSLTMDQLEELMQVKVDNERLRKQVAALKATIEARKGGVL